MKPPKKPHWTDSCFGNHVPRLDLCMACPRATECRKAKIEAMAK